ncbi:MAG TPA: substrate-binding domain-containing protein [Clostridiaceae bacterium]|nr:substrate-binding domain-containing protein [Clostridiaceae bacterium]
MSKRVTIYDISKELNLSATTVYRALKGKPKISDETRKLVIETAGRLGYKANRVAQSLTRKTIKIGVVFDGFHHGFSKDIIKGMQHAFNELMDFKVEGVYGDLSVPSTPSDVKSVLSELMKVVESGVNGIIFEPWLIREEYSKTINELAEKGIPTITIVSDVPNSKRIAYVRQNGKMVGDIGAQLLAMLNDKGNNAIFIGNRDVVMHSEVIKGFTARLKKSGMDPIAIYETQDDDSIAYYATDKLLRDYPQVGGIFVGTAHSTGVCKKINELGLRQKVKIVCTDVYPETVEYLENNTIQAIIHQEPYKVGEIAVKSMYKYLVEGTLPDKDVLINPKIVIKSNYEEYLIK